MIILMQNPALVVRGSKTRLLRPPLKVYSFSTPDPPFHQSIGRQGNSPPPSSSKEFFFDIISDNGNEYTFKGGLRSRVLLPLSTNAGFCIKIIIREEPFLGLDYIIGFNAFLTKYVQWIRTGLD
jgi:hypothetical protein